MEQGTEIMYFTFKGMTDSNKGELTVWMDKILKMVKYDSYSSGRTNYYIEITFVSRSDYLQLSWTSQSTRDDYYDRVIKAMFTIYPNEENPTMNNNVLTLKG